MDKGVGTTELLYYNALLSMPFLAVVWAALLTHPCARMHLMPAEASIRTH